MLLLPGWQNSGEGHWQTLWESYYGDQRVLQHDWMTPRRGDWMAQLDVAVAEHPAPKLLLAAHSLGCHLVAAWAQHSRHTGKIVGALLVAPPDTAHVAELLAAPYPKRTPETRIELVPSIL